MTRALPGVLLAAGGVVLAGVVCARAWVSDDAFITLRVVDNALAGFGLRWNTDERVEVYTHPLWLLLQLPLVAVFRNAFLVTIGLGVACTLGAFALALATLRADGAAAAVGFALPLACSAAFTGFATSGLENSLSFLLFAAVAALLARREPPGVALGLACALLLLNRLDTAFLLGPLLLVNVLGRRRDFRWPGFAVGFAPLVGWQLFRWLYYGFAYPNTKYAKLDTGAPLASRIEQGGRYALDFALRDPVGALLLLCGIAAALHAVARRARGRTAATEIGVAVGVLGYVAYVLGIGGDFMSGRFFALPVFAAAWLVLARLAALPAATARVVAAVLLVAVTGAQLARDRVLALRTGRFGGIVDERAFYAGTNTLFAADGTLRTAPTGHRWAQQGIELRVSGEPAVLVHGAVGMLGYYAGPRVRIIDPQGLTDPLLARLPPRADSDRPGHPRRDVPVGYVEARRTGSSTALPPALARYYEKLRRVTAGPLLDPERLRLIAAAALGSELAVLDRSDLDAAARARARAAGDGA